MMHSKQIAVINKELKDKVRTAIGNLNGEFHLFDENLNSRIEATEKHIKNGINDDFKEIINDEAVDKKLQCLTKTVKDLQTKNSKLEA